MYVLMFFRRKHIINISYHSAVEERRDWRRQTRTYSGMRSVCVGGGRLCNGLLKSKTTKHVRKNTLQSLAATHENIEGVVIGLLITQNLHKTAQPHQNDKTINQKNHTSNRLSLTSPAADGGIMLRHHLSRGVLKQRHLPLPTTASGDHTKASPPSPISAPPLRVIVAIVLSFRG